ncbi:MAG: hypothetical protein AB8B87_03170 [Granulosicoccus sp.]
MKLILSWVGHYAFNSFDHNAILGPQTNVENVLFVNRFSGHGLQLSPAMGVALLNELLMESTAHLTFHPSITWVSNRTKPSMKKPLSEAKTTH